MLAVSGRIARANFWWFGLITLTLLQLLYEKIRMYLQYLFPIQLWGQRREQQMTVRNKECIPDSSRRECLHGIQNWSIRRLYTHHDLCRIGQKGRPWLGGQKSTRSMHSTRHPKGNLHLPEHFDRTEHQSGVRKKEERKEEGSGFLLGKLWWTWRP